MSCDLLTEDGVNWWLVLALIAAWPITKWVLTVAYEVVKHLIPPADLLKRYNSNQGKTWAVVTGATDGIGLGFCEVLVKLGFNLVLISRNPDKLSMRAEELEIIARASGKGAELKTIAFNFKDSSDPVKYAKLIDELKTLDIGLFVNNVGTSDVRRYHTYTHQEIVDFINTNCVGMAALSADIIGLMKDRKTRSALINVSSYMEEKALPYLGLYSATKAFNKNLTEGLMFEYPNIDVLCLKPLFVESNLSRQKKGFGIPDRRECAEHTLKELRW